MSLLWAVSNDFSVPRGNSPRGEGERFLKEWLPDHSRDLLECVSSPHFAAVENTALILSHLAFRKYGSWNEFKSHVSFVLLRA